ALHWPRATAVCAAASVLRRPRAVGGAAPRIVFATGRTSRRRYRLAQTAARAGGDRSGARDLARSAVPLSFGRADLTVAPQSGELVAAFVPTQYAALVIPIAEHDPSARLPVDGRRVNGRAVRVTMNQAIDAELAKRGGDRVAVDVHDVRG